MSVKRILDYNLNNLSVAAVLVAAFALASCASSSSSSSGEVAERGQVLAMSEGEGTLALEKKFLMKKEDMRLTKEGSLAGGGKRSQFEGAKRVQFGGEWGKSDYEKQEYEKRSWWGGKKANVKNYEGGEEGSRFQKDSRYGSRGAKQSGQESRFSNADARTGNYEVEAATESRKGNVRTQADARTAWRRDVYPDPVVISKGDYEKQSIQQTRLLLGRDD